MQVETHIISQHPSLQRLKDQESPVRHVEVDCDGLKNCFTLSVPLPPRHPRSSPAQQHKRQNAFNPNLQPSSVQTSKQFPPASLVGDKYLMLEQVEGSTLYRCVNVHTQEELVCKVVGRESAGLLTAHYRVDSHPHINCLHEVLLGERYLYLVFPPAHGDLHSHVRLRKRLREPEARRLFRQIAETVRVCHEQGIVLRDLKLRKFVFADIHRNQLKLETLEDAVVLDDPEDDLLQDKRGCPAYVSPEILRCHSTYSGRAADMWSLGVILYTMLVGRYPFNDSEHASLFAKISRGNFIIPDCLSSRAKCLIRSLLRREPSERLSAADVLLHPWLVKEDHTDTAARLDQIVPEFPVKQLEATRTWYKELWEVLVCLPIRTPLEDRMFQKVNTTDVKQGTALTKYRPLLVLFSVIWGQQTTSQLAACDSRCQYVHPVRLMVYMALMLLSCPSAIKLKFSLAVVDYL